MLKLSDELLLSVLFGGEIGWVVGIFR